jgi:hypothetical protein
MDIVIPAVHCFVANHHNISIRLGLASIRQYAASGGGFVWDAVLEYRVWCHPENGAPDEEDGNDYYYPFASHPAALRFSKIFPGTEEPLALILQK